MEINRGLYQDEVRVEKIAGFQVLGESILLLGGAGGLDPGEPIGRHPPFAQLASRRGPGYYVLLCAGGVSCRFGRGVAQLGSAPASGAGGPGFKSRRPDSPRSAEGRLGWRDTGVWPAARLTARGFSTNPGAPTHPHKPSPWGG